MIRKPQFLSSNALKSALPASLSILGAAALTGCVSQTLDWYGPAFLVLFVALMPGAFLLSWAFGRFLRPAGHVRASDTLEDPYDIAFVAGGRARALHSAFGKLYGQKLIDIYGTKSLGLKVRKAEGASEAEPQLEEFEFQVLAAMPKPKDDHKTFAHLSVSLSPVLDRKREDLVSKGWMMTDNRRCFVQWLAALPVIALMIFGIMKTAKGLAEGHPVLFLILLIVLCAVFLHFRLKRISRRTKSGDQAWSSIKSERGKSLQRQVKDDPLDQAPSSTIPLAIAVLGPGVLAHAEGYEKLNRSIKASNAGQSSTGGCGSGCSTGCGGGGCGGGCGGCGD